MNYLLSQVIQIVNSDGNPEVNGKIYVYDHDLGTLADTYSDFEGHLNTNPVILDSLGHCVMIADETKYYDVIIKDRNDNLMFSLQKVSCVGGSGGVAPTPVDFDIIGGIDLAVKKERLLDDTLRFTVGVNTSSTIEGDLTLYPFAEGYNNTIEATATVYETTTTPSQGAHAEGSNNTVGGYASHVEGSSNTVKGICNHAEGSYNTAVGIQVHAEGVQNNVYGTGSHVEGNNNNVGTESNPVNYSHAEGVGNTITNNFAHAEGAGNTVSGMGAHAEGESNTASGKNSHASGYNVRVSGEESFGAGNNIDVSGNKSVAFGSSQNVKGHICSAFGGGNQVQGENNNAFGGGCSIGENSMYGNAFGASQRVAANSRYVTLFGANNDGAGSYVTVGGHSNNIDGNEISVAGDHNIVKNTEYANIDGHDNKIKESIETTEKSKLIHVFGKDNKVRVLNANDSEHDTITIEGNGNDVKGSATNVKLIGSFNTVETTNPSELTSDQIYAIGNNNIFTDCTNCYGIGLHNTFSDAWNAYAIGTNITAKSNNRIFGSGLISETAGQRFIFGKYNSPQTDTFFEFGSGSGPSTAARKNVIEIKNNDDIYYRYNDEMVQLKPGSAFHTLSGYSESQVHTVTSAELSAKYFEVEVPRPFTDTQIAAFKDNVIFMIDFSINIVSSTTSGGIIFSLTQSNHYPSGGTNARIIGAHNAIFVNSNMTNVAVHQAWTFGLPSLMPDKFVMDFNLPASGTPNDFKSGDMVVITAYVQAFGEKA